MRSVLLRSVFVATAVLSVTGVSGCSAFRPSNDSLAELAGPDVNNNAIRDDVETRIRELTSDPLGRVGLGVVVDRHVVRSGDAFKVKPGGPRRGD